MKAFRNTKSLLLGTILWTNTLDTHLSYLDNYLENTFALDYKLKIAESSN